MLAGRGLETTQGIHGHSVEEVAAAVEAPTEVEVVNIKSLAHAWCIH